MTWFLGRRSGLKVIGLFWNSELVPLPIHKDKLFFINKEYRGAKDSNSGLTLVDRGQQKAV